MYVVGARNASSFALPVGSEVFEESGRSLVRGTLDYLQGLKVCFIRDSLLHSQAQTKFWVKYCDVIYIL